MPDENYVSLISVPKSQRLEILELAQECFQRRRDGESVAQIAEAMGLTIAQVKKHIIRGLKASMPTSQEALRQLEIARMEEIGRILMAEIADGHAMGRLNSRHVEMYIRSSEQRAKLAALDKTEPQMVNERKERQVSGPVVIDIVRDPGATPAQPPGEAVPPPAEGVG